MPSPRSSARRPPKSMALTTSSPWRSTQMEAYRRSLRTVSELEVYSLKMIDDLHSRSERWWYGRNDAGSGICYPRCRRGYGFRRDHEVSSGREFRITSVPMTDADSLQTCEVDGVLGHRVRHRANWSHPSIPLIPFGARESPWQA